MPVPHPVAGSPFPKVNSFIPIIAQNTNEKKEEGRADHSPPKITMLNNAQLKETLNQKLTTHADEARPIFTTSSRQDEPIDSLTLPTLNIVLTFSVPLADLQGQIERIYSLIQSLGLASSVQYQAKPSLVKPPTPIVIPEPVRATASSPIRVSAVPTPSSTAMTGRQKKMIFALIAKKKLSADEVADIMEREVGHQDGARLTKAEASKLIGQLMAK